MDGPEGLGLLRDELNALTAKFVDVIPKDVMELATAKQNALGATDFLDLALKEGDALPDFCLPDSNGNLISSVDLRERGPIVITFFRGSFCSYCQSTLKMIRKYNPYFAARGATVVAISGQTQEESAKLVKDAGLNFHVLSDVHHEYAQLCNIAFVLDEYLKTIYESTGIKFEEIFGDDSHVLPIPATYVVNTNGRVVYSFLETVPSKRAEPVDVLNALPRIKPNRRKSLSEDLQIELANLREKHSDQKMKRMFDSFEQLRLSGADRHALKVGDKAPNFKLRDKDGKSVDSKRLRKQGPIVVTFFHGPYSQLCMLTLRSLQKYLQKFEAKGATLVAVAPPGCSDDLDKAASYSGARFTLLNDDADHSLSKGFGVSHDAVDYLSDCSGAMGGPSGTENDWNQTVVLPFTATYIIDRSGMIVYSYVDVDHTKRPEPVEVLKYIPAYRPAYNLKFGPFSVPLGKRMVPKVAFKTRPM